MSESESTRPADEAPAERSTSVVKSRPRRMAVYCSVLAAIMVAAFTVFALILPGKTDGGGAWGNGDRTAMVVLGIFVGLAVLWFTRPRVTADADGIRIRNMFASYDLPWQVVVKVRFDDGASWASLDLADDDQVYVMAIQRLDGEHAVAAMRGLRELHANSRRTHVGHA